MAALLPFLLQPAQAEEPWRAAEKPPAIELAAVPGGCFRMGDGESRHEVCLDDFMIARYPVTQRQWQQVMGGNPSYFKGCGADCPVEKVSWLDAQEFIRQLNVTTGRNYRLPTEAEWEYACRGGDSGQVYCGGNDIDAVGWYDGNSNKTTHPVGLKQPNRLGIHDMSGNVWQWVADWHDNYPAGKAINPQGPPTGQYRVCRGGSWALSPLYLGATFRFSQDPGFRTYQLGFRLAAPVR